MIYLTLWFSADGSEISTHHPDVTPDDQHPTYTGTRWMPFVSFAVEQLEYLGAQSLYSWAMDQWDAAYAPITRDGLAKLAHELALAAVIPAGARVVVALVTESGNFVGVGSNTTVADTQNILLAAVRGAELRGLDR